LQPVGRVLRVLRVRGGGTVVVVVVA